MLTPLAIATLADERRVEVGRQVALARHARRSRQSPRSPGAALKGRAWRLRPRSIAPVCVWEGPAV